jgi:hypothetical protein
VDRSPGRRLKRKFVSNGRWNLMPDDSGCSGWLAFCFTN